MFYFACRFLTLHVDFPPSQGASHLIQCTGYKLHLLLMKLLTGYKLHLLLISQPGTGYRYDRG
eukprot:COSAG06_NODE_14207_length_1179_cov_1.362037_2_plen_62_part_01